MHGLSSARHTKDEAGERSASERIIVHPFAHASRSSQKPGAAITEKAFVIPFFSGAHDGRFPSARLMVSPVQLGPSSSPGLKNHPAALASTCCTKIAYEKASAAIANAAAAKT
jgi:hypothetical protein